MLSKTSRYGVRSVLHLALYTGPSYLMGVKELAQKIMISEPMLSKILQSLTKKKLIESKKGRNGGFFMTQDQKSNSLMKVIRELEQSDRLIKDCMLGQKSCETCDQCPYSEMVASIRTELKSIYGTDTIEETAQKLKSVMLT